MRIGSFVHIYKSVWNNYTIQPTDFPYFIFHNPPHILILPLVMFSKTAASDKIFPETD